MKLFKDILKEKMSGSEVGKKMGITKMGVSKILTRSLGKMFDETKKIDKTWNNFEVAVALAQMIGVDQGSESELKKFFKLFPSNIKSKIEEDAAKLMRK
jgi:predicted transcriptional regulator